MLAIVCQSCRQDDGAEARHAPADGALVRGDQVVVEGSAATFFQGRVLEVGSETIRVQTAEEGDPVSVPLGDAYRLPPRASKLQRGAYAICNAKGKHWIACRVQRADPRHVEAVDSRGGRLELPRKRIVTPTAVTSLNIQRHFGREGERRKFADAAKRAGEPLAPPGWGPRLGDRVVARHDSGWYSARIGAWADAGVEVTWDGDGRKRVVSRGDVVAPPPHGADRAVGDFALVAPATPARPWRPVRIVSKEGSDAVTVVDENGVRSQSSPRDLIPIGR